MSALDAARHKIAEAIIAGPWPDDLEPRQVFPVLPDAIPGPCYAVVPSEPALDPLTPCNWTARFDVIAVAGRVSIEDAQRTLDAMVEFVLPRLREAGISIERVGSDDLISWGNVNYLTRRVTVWAVVTI